MGMLAAIQDNFLMSKRNTITHSLHKFISPSGVAKGGLGVKSFPIGSYEKNHIHLKK